MLRFWGAQNHLLLDKLFAMKPLHLLYALMLIALGAPVQAQIKEINPPNWWAGMEHSSLQLMIYGPGIGSLNAEVQGKGPLQKTEVENPNYLFLDWDTQGLAAGTYTLIFKEAGVQKFSVDYQLQARKPASALRQGFDSSDVVYLIMPDRFANGDPNNDQTNQTFEPANRDKIDGRHGGDLKGIIDRVDYLKDLGVTAVWTTPVLADNDRRGSYHGYACSDAYQIDPRFGTNEDYALLAKTLHQNDMKLIKDYVTNHWGLEHWMIKDLPFKDWIHQFSGENGYGQTNYRLSTVFDPNAAPSDTYLSEKGWFVPSMPDLNQSHPLVLTYLIQNAIWWVEYADLDGFRVDTYPYGEKEGMTRWTEAIMKEYPNFNIVGETWYSQAAHVAYWQKDSPVGAIQGFNGQLPSVMDFPFHMAAHEAFTDQPSWNKGLVQFYDVLANDFLYPDVNQLFLFIENHDTTRFNQLFPDHSAYKMALSILMTTRGIPQIYYGSEIGMLGDKSKGDGDLRRDFPGGWPSDSRDAARLDQRTDQENNYHHTTRTLLQWRKNNEAIHRGKTVHYAPVDQVYVYFRFLEDQWVMVLANGSNSPKSIDLQKFKEVWTAPKEAYWVFDQKTNPVPETLTVQARDVIILSNR